MKKKLTVLALGAMLFALSYSASAQQPAKVSRRGFLSTTSRSNVSTRLEAFRQGLRELGYVEGKNIVIEYRLSLIHISEPTRLLSISYAVFCLKKKKKKQKKKKTKHT